MRCEQCRDLDDIVTAISNMAEYLIHIQRDPYLPALIRAEAGFLVREAKRLRKEGKSERF